MQIDFHHGATYVICRWAGLEHQAASIVAYAAQYVDDAINEGLIAFDNGALFDRSSSAHKALDYRNFDQLANYRVWIPFHFLPGNGGLPAGQDPGGSFINKLICLPNSPVAQGMMTECIQQKNKPYGLHRLGIAMHVYADTWAHQGFAGVIHRVNEAKDLVDDQGEPDRGLEHRRTKFFNPGSNHWVNQMIGGAIGDTFPLGHGAVLSHPDKPFLKWGYTNGLEQKINRNNPQDFLEAADHMAQWLKRFQLGDAIAPVTGLSEEEKHQLMTMFTTIISDDKEERHHQWLTAIKEGRFSFGPVDLTYIPKGKNSWKYYALGTEETTDNPHAIYPYHPDFLTSDWKLFHDGLEAHRFYLTHELLPQYGICVA